MAMLLAMMRSVCKAQKLPWLVVPSTLNQLTNNLVSVSDAKLLKIALKSGPDAVKLFDVLAQERVGSVVGFQG